MTLTSGRHPRGPRPCQSRSTVAVRTSLGGRPSGGGCTRSIHVRGLAPRVACEAGPGIGRGPGHRGGGRGIGSRVGVVPGPCPMEEDGDKWEVQEEDQWPEEEGIQIIGIDGRGIIRRLVSLERGIGEERKTIDEFFFAEERKIVYVGRLESDTTKEELRRKFITYGVVKLVTLHEKTNG